MTTSRLLTTLVQIGIGIPALLMLRLVIRDLIHNKLD
jgi:hypothetical protein